MRLLSFLIGFFLSMDIYSQKIVEHTIYSNYLEDERLIKIWIPEDFTSENTSNVIYVFDANYFFDVVTANVNYYSDPTNEKMPSTIVIGIFYKNLSDRYDIGYLPKLGRLDSIGTKFYGYVTEEISAFIRKNYVTDPYNVMLGWSYLANYADYFMINNSEFFQAYLLFSPEVIPISKYKLSILKNKRIFIGSADWDTKERKQYAEDLDSVFQKYSNVIFKHSQFKQATHDDIVLKALPYALEYLYKDYLGANINSNKIPNESSMLGSYFLAENLNKKNYKTSVRKNARNFAYFTLLSNHTFTANELDSLVAIFIAESNDPNLLELIGGVYLKSKDYIKAEEYLLKSIRKYKEASMPHGMHNVYKMCGLNLYYNGLNNYEKAKKIFKEAQITMPNLHVFYYYLGLIEIGSNKDIEEGVQNIHQYLDIYYTEEFPYPLSKVYALLAQGYYKLNELHKAEIWLTEAIKISPADPEIRKLKEILDAQ